MKFINIIATKFALIAILACSSCISLSNFANNTQANKNSNSSSSKSKPWNHKAKQNTVYSCHTFVAIGLIEAEYYRTTGKKIDLSEADLFLKHIKQGAPNWDAALSLYLAKGVKTENPAELETGYVQESYSLIQKYGVAMEKEMKYTPSGRIGIPLAMRILRSSAGSIKQGIKNGEPQSELTVARINQIKKDGAFKVLSKEQQFFASRNTFKQFASLYDLKKMDVRSKDNVAMLKNMISSYSTIGLIYRVPKKSNPLLPSNQNHTLILTGFDEKKQHFTVRDSDSKGLFGNHELTVDFVKRFASKTYYLQKKR